MATYKDKIIKEYLESSAKVGDWVEVKRSTLSSITNNPNKKEIFQVIEVFEDESIKIKCSGDYKYLKEKTISKNDYEKSTFFVGVNPFPVKNWLARLKTVDFDLDNILYRIGWDKKKKSYKFDKVEDVEIPELNWNPYVINKGGKKEYYQRGFCWDLKDKQLLIESIYNGINCGKIIVRKRSWKYIEDEVKKGNKEVCFLDLVDGKQRLNTILEFIQDKFKDLHGYYFSDLSDKAKHTFLSTNLISYAEMEEESTDQDVINTFLMINFTGRVMSQEHIDYIREIQRNL